MPESGSSTEEQTAGPTVAHPEEHYRDQSSLSRDLLRCIHRLQEDPNKPPYGVNIIELVEQDYYGEKELEDVDRSAIYDRLTDLNESGLITKHNTTEDGRKKAYVLTQNGEKILQQLYEAYVEQLNGISTAGQ
jgi:DNA-binding PadR family transcriptional regulator